MAAASKVALLVLLVAAPPFFNSYWIGLLTQALSRAQNATDEAAAVEQLGLRPRLVLGSRQNLKVTYPEDVAIAEAILARSA